MRHIDNRRTGRTTRHFTSILFKGEPKNIMMFPTYQMAKFGFNMFREYIEGKIPLSDTAFNLMELIAKVRLLDRVIEIRFKGMDNPDKLNGLDPAYIIHNDHTMFEGQVRRSND